MSLLQGLPGQGNAGVVVLQVLCYQTELRENRAAGKMAVAYAAAARIAIAQFPAHLAARHRKL